jgi:hypothetical protein
VCPGAGAQRVDPYRAPSLSLWQSRRTATAKSRGVTMDQPMDYPWFYMVLYGFKWFYMVLYGFIWFIWFCMVYMVFLGFMWFNRD